MQRKKLVWLFNNLDNYDYINEGVAIKETFSRLLVTNDTLDNADIRAKAMECYDQFVANFYNDILGYQNGLSNKSITASTLDCYFVSTGDGYIPIGLYKEQRPAETAVMLQAFLEQCKTNIKNDRNKAIAGWQNDIADIAGKYNANKDKKSPSLLKAIAGMIFSTPLLLYGCVNLFNTGFYNTINYNNENANVVLENYQLLEKTGKSGLIVLILICSALMLSAIVFIINSVRELLLIGEEKNTADILSNIHGYVNLIEKGTASFINNSAEQCFEAARRGENITVNKNDNAKLINDVKKKIKKALEYVNKTDKARGAVGIKTILGIVLSYILIFTVVFLQIPKNSSESTPNSNTYTTNIPTEQSESTQSKDLPQDKQQEVSFNIYRTGDIISYVNTDFPTEKVNQTPSYKTYHDDKFKFEIDYPTHFKSEKVQDGVTRRIYVTDDGSAVLKINAGSNLGGITSQQLCSKLISTYGGDVTYNPVADTWFALSVNGSEDYHYAYYKLDGGEIRGFEFHFNGAENDDKYSKYIDHIYESFKKY